MKDVVVPVFKLTGLLVALEPRGRDAAGPVRNDGG